MRLACFKSIQITRAILFLEILGWTKTGLCYERIMVTKEFFIKTIYSVVGLLLVVSMFLIEDMYLSQVKQERFTLYLSLMTVYDLIVIALVSLIVERVLTFKK
jgi:hypothetical protein